MKTRLKLNPLPVTIDTSVAIPAAIVRVMDRAVDYRHAMLGNAYNQPAHRQFPISQVDLTTRSDLHCWIPFPAKASHQPANRGNMHPLASMRAAFCLSKSFTVGLPIYFLVNDLVRIARSNSDCPTHTVSSIAAIARNRSSAVIKDPFHFAPSAFWIAALHIS